MQKKTSSPGSRIVIKGEGRDEWRNRYFKFAVRGTKSNIPPFSVEEIIKNPNSLFVELNNAGASAFSGPARRELLDRLDSRKPTPPAFKVVTRLGWNSGAFVLPGKIIGQPQTPAGALVPAPGPATAGQVPGAAARWRTGSATLVGCVPVTLG